MRSRLFRQPPSWGWFVTVMLLTVSETASGHHLALATGLPYLAAAALRPQALRLPLWTTFTLGAAINAVAALTSPSAYLVAAIYGLLVVYGGDEAWKCRSGATESAGRPT